MLYDSEIGMKFISILLGFGLASLFRQVCKDDKCRVVKGPNMKDMERQLYKIDEKCYKYKPVATICEDVDKKSPRQ
uniref:Uncharacterized protein n=1 Tax=Pyramimonas orientalis virus TaxID=455367 RepID=A0A7M3UNZ0_POV01|nr:hypothetical protein HWQ62_00301 [Pyramimonas orientalis virus]